MNEINKLPYRLEPPFFEIEENFEKVKLTIYNAKKMWCNCVNIDNGMIGVYNLNTYEYIDLGLEPSKYYGFEAEEVRMNHVRCEIKKNDKVLICPFPIYDTKGIVVSILNESKQWYDEQVSKLEAKNLILGRKYKESSSYFKEAGYKLTYETIDYVTFFDFLLKKIPLLEVVYSTVEDEVKPIMGVYKVTYLWDKSNIIDDLGILAFAEYEKLVYEPSINILDKELKDKDLLPSGKKIPSPAEQIIFEQLFKDKSDVGKILGYLDEYISDKGEWIYKPQVRCLVALCMVLEKKGYFLNTWTNPIKAQVLSLKFGVPCTPKSFQASERWKSEHLIELFNIIPTKIIS